MYKKNESKMKEILNGKLHFLCSVKIIVDRLDQFAIIISSVNVI